jgi:predicted 3-demethylubiquinone-9 3-methyltransferase (glyoxalase superfamily)
MDPPHEETSAMTKIMPCLWFNNRIDEAIDFYTSTFPQAKLKHVVRQKADGPAYTAVIELAGHEFFLLNGSGADEPMFQFNESVSFMIECADQAEVDHYWHSFVDNGGQESMCGWCKDKFGLSWQVTPVQMYTTVLGSDPAGAKRATDAMMGMRKLVIADLERAYAGG